MRLIEIRQFMKENKPARSLRRLLLGDPIQLRQLKHFLHEYRSEPDDYLFSPSDIFNLVIIIELQNKLDLISRLKDKLAYQKNHFSDIINVLKRTHLLTKNNFKDVYLLDDEGKNLFYILFCYPSISAIPLTQMTLNIILDLYQSGCQGGELVESIKLLNQNALFAPGRLSFLVSYFGANSVPIVTNIMLTLGKAKLFTRKNILYLIASKDVATLAVILNTLYTKKILNEKILQLICQKQNIRILNEIMLMLSNPELLAKNSLLTAANLENILSFSENDFESFYHFLIKTHKNKLLDQLALSAIFNILTTKMPRVEVSSRTKISAKESGLKRSSWHINNKLTLYLNHGPKKYAYEGFSGKVAKAYDSLDAKKIKYSAKKIKFKKLANTFSEDIAKKEVAYHHLFGRQAFYFKNKKDSVYIVADWLHGKKLSYFKKTEILKHGLWQRLEWLISVLTDINFLHSHFYVHGDINADNMILNVKKNALHLIDFGLSEQVKQLSKSIPKIKENGEVELEFENLFSADIKAMCVIIENLFPECFKVEANVLGQAKLFKQAMLSLLEAMHTIDLSCEDILTYCQQFKTLLQNDQYEKLDQLIADTLHKEKLNLSDVLHGFRSAHAFSP